jgi:hypothetical protein
MNKIFKPEDLLQIPPLYKTDGDNDPMVQFMLYNFYQANQYWLIIEYDPIEKIAYALCDLNHGCAELGYVLIIELESLISPRFVLEINREFKAEPLSKAKRQALKFINMKLGGDNV